MSNKRYSDEFKKKCVDAVKSGKYKSIREVARVFDVSCHKSILNWLNPEKAKEYAKKSYKKNMEYYINYRETHKEQKKIYITEYNKTHKEQRRKNDEEYRKTHKEQRKKIDTEYNKKHREQRRIYSNEYNRMHKVQKKIYDVTPSSKLRGIKSIILFDNPFPDDIPVCYHHLHYTHPYFTVPTPEKIHRIGNKNHEKHFDHCRKWIEKLYSMDIYNLLHLNKHHWKVIRFDGSKEPSKYCFVAQRFDI